MNPNIIDLIIFHYPCQDGLGAAWIAHNYLTKLNKPHEFLPIQNGNLSDQDLENIYDQVRGQNVMIVDYAFTRVVCENIKSIAKNLIILDHHVTNKESLSGLDYAIFDMKLSGIGLAWKYFYSDISTLPLFLQMLQDRDLWAWKVPKSSEFCNGFYTVSCVGQDFFKAFEFFEELFNVPDTINKYIQTGTEIKEARDKYINELAIQQTKFYEFTHKDQTYNIQIVECAHNIASDLGNTMCKLNGCDFCMLWRYNESTGEYYVSCRSIGDIDVATIAKSYGGGGHKNAAGFTLYDSPINMPNVKPREEKLKILI